MCNLLDFMYSLICFIAILAFSNADVALSSETKVFVSSAKSTNLAKSHELTKSFIYIKNSNGPSTLPCGTPYFIQSLG